MKIEIRSGDQFVTTHWSGGTTTEMFLWPPDGNYANREFKVRISSATIEEETSIFSRLDGIQRYLSVLEGQITLKFNDMNELHVKPYNVIEFSGSDKTVSNGICRDFNLMLKGCEGNLTSYKLTNSVEIECKPGYFYIFYSESLCYFEIMNQESGDSDRVSLQDSYSLEKGIAIVSHVENIETFIFSLRNKVDYYIDHTYILCAEIKI